VVPEIAMGELLRQVDEVHLLTSLAGFEALLRGKRVVCHGQPFYAGWGLTEDVLPVSRRTRGLTLDELVAGVLILYPAYVSCTTGRFTSPERTLDELLAWRERSASALPWWRTGLRWLLRMGKS
jgi:capsular polysaccharide export protein